jgi:hypothetical protein
VAKVIDNPLLSAWSGALAAAGISGLALLEDATDQARQSANGQATFRWEGMTLRLLRDRGQDFVEVAPAAASSPAWSLDDLAVALGWRTVESVVARQQPAVLVDELREIVARRNELNRAFAPSELVKTTAAVDDARSRRERAFIEKLNKLSG